MATHKVQGFNSKEQKIFNRLLDYEPHDIRELKKIFWKDAETRCKETFEPGWGEHEVNAQAQSFVRNSIRRLVRDGWVEKCARGTYRMTRTGKARVERGDDVTKSFTESQRGKGGGKKKATKAKPKKKATKAKPKKKAAAKSKPKQKAAKKGKSKAKAKSKGNGVKAKKVSTDKVKKMKAKAKQAAMKEKIADQQDAAAN